MGESEPEHESAGLPTGPGAGRARFTVLGLLAIADSTEVAVLQPSKPAALLAALLVRPNAVVSAESLQRVIWGEETPATAKAALQTCVLRLRRLFGKYGISGNTIEAVPGGYRMAADAQTLDLLHFRSLLGRASGAPDLAGELDLLREALALWQLPVLTNVHSDALHLDEVPRLTEEWLRTAERIFDIELALGRCREALAELRPVAHAHPLHERFWEQLIEALHRTGRRAEALAEYRRVKQHLLTELGVDPGPALRRLELDILRGDPGPALRPAGRRPGPNTPDGEGGAPATGELVLASLVQAGLLEEGPHGQYRMHDLLRVFTRAAAGSRHRAPPEQPSDHPAHRPAEHRRGSADRLDSPRQAAAPLRTTEV